MALGISIPRDFDPSSRDWVARKKGTIHFEDPPGIGRFVWPYFEAANRMIGLEINIIGDEQCSVEDLPDFRRIIEQAKKDCETLPDEVSLSSGPGFAGYTSNYPTEFQVHWHIVKKARILKWLDALLALTDEAYEKRLPLLFQGD